MSFSRSKRDQIKKYILEIIESGQGNIASKTSDAFAISENSIYRYLRELLTENIIVKGKNGQYTINSEYYEYFFKSSDKPDEGVILDENIKKHLEGLPENVYRIWQYGFSEIMNNAIDHSKGKNIHVSIIKNPLNITMKIEDDGIGLFKKIKEHFNLPTMTDARTELFKGKLTTDDRHHSGEGIFFTSRIMDMFAVISGGLLYSYNERDEIEKMMVTSGFDEVYVSRDRGTVIIMKLSNASNKELKELFDRYADVEGGFTKTSIPLKNIYDDYPISRSQAKRLYNRFDRFEEVILDFTGVSEIGQAFAHELFIVFGNEHPEINLKVQNAGESVLKMINHVKRT